MRARIVLCAVPFVCLLATGCDALNWAPPDEPPEPSCDVSAHLPKPENTTVPPAPLCPATGNVEPCNCEDYTTLYGGKIPPGVFDPAGVTWPCPLPYDPSCKPGNPNPGCAPWLQYAAPSCARHAEVSGRFVDADVGEHSSASGAADDDDYFFDICPNSQTMYRVDRDRRASDVLQELRTYQSFGIGWEATMGTQAQGRIHVEVQKCRHYRGGYTVPRRDPVTDQIVDKVTFNEVKPTSGDAYVTAVGDWVLDGFCGLNVVDHLCHFTEIHEARGLAVFRRQDPSDASRFFGFVTTFLVDAPRHNTGIYFDAFVPPHPPNRLKLECKWEDAAEPNRPCGFQDANRRHTAFRYPAEAKDVAGQPTCRVRFECNTDQCTYKPLDHKCYGACADDKNWEALYDGSKDAACNQLLYAGVLSAVWKDPADVWVCTNCACDDSSTPGATIAAPVQGCVAQMLDPTKPEDQRKVCEAICPGKEICGGAPHCAIGACKPPLGTALAVRIVEAACDPERQVIGSVSPSGDYLVSIQSSTMTASDGSDTFSRPVTGSVYLNVSEGIADLASVQLQSGDFETHGRNVSETRLANSDRVIAQMDGSSLQVPAGLGVFVLRFRLDGELKGAEFQNPQRIDGSFDPTTGKFTALVEAVRPGSEGKVRLSAPLQGTVINRPPIADPTRTPATVECRSQTATSVVLDATASSDSDPGDSISHVQWFRATGEGLGNQSRQTIALPLGALQYRLHVYDQKLGSHSNTGTVRVVDTTPPTLSLSPKSFCIWPPNHPRIKFELGKEIAFKVADTCDPIPDVRIVSVTSNEPDNAKGDGNTVGDVSFGPKAFCVRRERSGTGSDRIYTVTVQAKDASGNVSRQDVTVRIPHNQEHEFKCDSKGTVISETEACN